MSWYRDLHSSQPNNHLSLNETQPDSGRLACGRTPLIIPGRGAHLHYPPICLPCLPCAAHNYKRLSSDCLVFGLLHDWIVTAAALRFPVNRIRTSIHLFSVPSLITRTTLAYWLSCSIIAPSRGRRPPNRGPGTGLASPHHQQAHACPSAPLMQSGW